jgi:hypothetical protein
VISFIKKPDNIVPVKDVDQMRELIPNKKKWCEENTRWRWGLVYYITNPRHDLWGKRELIPDTNFLLLIKRIKEGNIYVNSDQIKE